MKKIENMEALEKAALLEAIAKIMEANVACGTFKQLEQKAQLVATNILKSIE